MNFNTFQQQLGRNIAAARVRSGLKQTDVEERTGLEYKHYQKIEGGHIDVKLSTLFRLAKLFRVSISELVTIAPRKLDR